MQNSRIRNYGNTEYTEERNAEQIKWPLSITMFKGVTNMRNAEKRNTELQRTEYCTKKPLTFNHNILFSFLSAFNLTYCCCIAKPSLTEMSHTQSPLIRRHHHSVPFEIPHITVRGMWHVLPLLVCAPCTLVIVTVTVIINQRCFLSCIDPQ